MSLRLYGFLILKMKIRLLILLMVILLTNHSLKAQCDCYTVNKIWIPENTSNIVNITFSNTCGEYAYLQFFLIQNRDTLARFDKCYCGYIDKKGYTTTYELATNIKFLPPINSLRVTFDNRCPSIKFSPELFVLSTEPQNNSEVTMYPNPTDDSINLENIPINTNIQLYNLQGVFLQEWVFKEKQKISLKSYPSGTYLIKYQISNHTITHKIFKQ